MLEAGASGYLTRRCPLAQFIAGRRERDEAIRQLSRRTPREGEVVALLAQGGDNETIAESVVISPETARTHVGNLMGKLEVHSRLQAAAFVREHGLLEELVGSRL